MVKNVQFMIESAVDWREQVKEDLEGREDYSERGEQYRRNQIEIGKIEEDSIIQSMFETIM